MPHRSGMRLNKLAYPLLAFGVRCSGLVLRRIRMGLRRLHSMNLRGISACSRRLLRVARRRSCRAHGKASLLSGEQIRGAMDVGNLISHIVRYFAHRC